jgi:hypothetical protein
MDLARSVLDSLRVRFRERSLERGEFFSAFPLRRLQRAGEGARVALRLERHRAKRRGRSLDVLSSRQQDAKNDLARGTVSSRVMIEKKNRKRPRRTDRVVAASSSRRKKKKKTKKDQSSA